MVTLVALTGRNWRPRSAPLLNGLIGFPPDELFLVSRDSNQTLDAGQSFFMTKYGIHIDTIVIPFIETGSHRPPEGLAHSLQLDR